VIKLLANPFLDVLQRRKRFPWLPFPSDSSLSDGTT
jgi:hypothetical protein